MRWCTELKICSLSLSQKCNIKMQTGRVLPETIRVRYATSKSQGMPEKKRLLGNVRHIDDLRDKVALLCQDPPFMHKLSDE